MTFNTLCSTLQSYFYFTAKNAKKRNAKLAKKSLHPLRKNFAPFAVFSSLFENSLIRIENSALKINDHRRPQMTVNDNQ
jgi:hypothetical protein